MKKGQKRMFKFLNKAFKNAIILKQLRIDELKLVESREKWLRERQGAKVDSAFAEDFEQRAKDSWEQKFPSGGVMVGVDFGASKDEGVLPKWVAEGLNKKEEKEEKIVSKKDFVTSQKGTRPTPKIKDGCDCVYCQIERAILKNVPKKDD